MKKSLLAVAVAAALPAAAMAQVTITGYAKGSVDTFSIGDANAARLGKTSENRVTDHSSRIIFSANERIDDDLSGVFQLDIRFNVDQTGRLGNENPAAGNQVAAPSAVINPLSSGNNHVGIVSKSMGALRMGRSDIYYGVTGSVLPSSTHINASAPTVLHNPAGGGMANHSRTPNLVWYETPTVQGFKATVGYSTNPLRASGTNETENDLGTTSATRKGSGTFLQLNGQVGPVALTFATVDLKSDYFGGTCFRAPATGATLGSCAFELTGNAQPNQKGNVISAVYRAGPIALGAAYSDNSSTTNANVKTSRTAYNLSGAYTMGKNTFAAEYQNGGDQTVAGVKAADTGLTGTVLAYDYAFSKRTNLGLTYFVLNNDAKSGIGPFYSTSNTFGGQFTALAGEKYTVTSLVLRHSW